MGSSTADNLHPKTKRMILELLKGKEIAVQLQNLLKTPAAEADEVVSAGELVLQITRSFSNALSELSSTKSTQILSAAVDRGKRRMQPSPTGLKIGGVVTRGGRSSDSWIVKSSTTEDGFAWRKYGQKVILNSQFHRSYYRCTYKYEGCKAIKQVQMIKSGKPDLYQTTYINHHTCTKTSTSPYASHLINFYPSNSAESKNVISFQKTQDGDLNNPIIPSIISPLKLEEQSTTDDQEVLSDAKSSTSVTDKLEEMGSGLLSSSESIILQYPDDDQFADELGSFLFFDNDISDHVF